MADPISSLAPQIWDLIQKSQNILLHLHPSPDQDSAGSALAFWWALTNLGKNPVVFSGDSEKPNWLDFLPGGDRVVIKNYFEIHPQNFDLFIIVDASSPDQISKIGNITFTDTLRTIVIDHHQTNRKYAELNLVDTDSPATGQLVYDLFKLWNINFTPEIAACLFTAIYFDTGGFKYPLTTPKTFRIAGDLIDIYPDFSTLIFNMENQNDPENLLFLGLALSSIEHYFQGHVAISAVSYDRLQKLGITKKHTEKMEVSNFLKTVIGWDIGILFVETQPDIIGLSFRTRDFNKYDVSKIAVATGFGGGHPAAAGATLKMPFTQAKKLLLDSIAKTYPDLGEP
jgi:phosphoesterase RecJ-like protein